MQGRLGERTALRLHHFTREALSYSGLEPFRRAQPAPVKTQKLVGAAELLGVIGKLRIGKQVFFKDFLDGRVHRPVGVLAKEFIQPRVGVVFVRKRKSFCHSEADDRKVVKRAVGLWQDAVAKKGPTEEDPPARMRFFYEARLVYSC